MDRVERFFIGMTAAATISFFMAFGLWLMTG